MFFLKHTLKEQYAQDYINIDKKELTCILSLTSTKADFVRGIMCESP